ncbi:MAG: hypothetical protein HZC28_16105 [Spirochaetes bacterium]|nr:hypothetical protein [Spirochaetota bacterium]
MPSFTVSIDELASAGPLVGVVLSPAPFLMSRLKSDGREVYSDHVTAMIDTGASHSVMASQLPFISQLTPAGTTDVATPTSLTVTCYEYRVLVTFPSDVEIESNIIAVPYLTGGVQCLIGRDILRHAVLVYNGTEKLITMSF